MDNSAVHPENYDVVVQMAKKMGVSVSELIGNTALLNKIDIKEFVTANCGEYTLKDIIEELKKPGRDPRGKITSFQFDDRITSIDELSEGMILSGIVTNITKFGAFVDVGVKQDGLVHLSQLANRFVSDPNEVVRLHQHVKVKVVEVDLARKRIQLSMKDVTQD